MPNQIVLKSSGGHHEEGRAAAAISPGDLVEYDSDGGFKRHATAGGAAAPAFAKEDPLNAGRTIDDDFAADELVPVHYAAKGDDIYAWLASGESVTEAALLMSDGAGKFEAYAAPTVAADHPVALVRALETVDATAAAARIRVRVL